MSEQKNTITGGPAKEQAPVPSTDSTAQTTQAPQIANPGKPAEEATASSTQTNSTEALALDYLSGGYYKGEGKQSYPNPSLVDHAEGIGKSLAAGGVTATAFNRLLRTLKAAKNKPFEAQEGALKKLTVQVIDLDNKKKAPPLLREIVERHREAVHSPADFAACLDHFRDIYIYLAAQVEAEGTPT